MSKKKKKKKRKDKYFTGLVGTLRNSCHWEHGRTRSSNARSHEPEKTVERMTIPIRSEKV